MPTITVRLDEETRDGLQQRANEDGVTVSDFVRDLIREQVISVRSDDDRLDDGYAPDSLTPKDRQVLSLLHRILARVLPEDANGDDGDSGHQLELAQVLEAGFTEEYGVEFAGISPELSRRDSQRVNDILEMFRIAGYSLVHLEKSGTSVSEGLTEALRYQGFDHNNALEHKMASYVRHLVADSRWTEQAGVVNGPSGGNSHSPRLGLYMRMLGEYRRIIARRGPAIGRNDYLLSEDQLRAIAAERIHPDNRKGNR